jgi:nucleoside-diphosphate-sugar epimerase
MKVLVTGATGFVGRPLCRSLRQRAFTVVAALRAPSPFSDADNSAIVGDIGPETDWSVALQAVDTVVHLAGRVHQMDASAAGDVDAFHRINVQATERLAQEAARLGVRRLVYVSSTKAMGERTEPAKPFSEDDRPKPNDAYGVSKWEAEQAIQRVAAQTGLQTAILRPPLVYGPGVRANFLNLMRLVDSGIPLPFGCIDNRRSLIYVNNLTDALLACIAHPNAAGQVFMVADAEDLSTAQLVRELSRSLGVRARLAPVPVSLLCRLGRILGQAAVVERLTESLTVDSRRIRNTLGWNPPYSISRGFDETAEWFRRHAKG